MNIDFSRASAFRDPGPASYYEKYERDGTGLEKKPKGLNEYTPLDYGGRMHELLQEHYDPKAHPSLPSTIEALELEARIMMAAYIRHYPVEPFDVVDVERTFKVPLNERHNLVGKIDLAVTYSGTKVLDIIDHKTEKRGGRGNSAVAWAAKDQASIYLYAAKQIYRDFVIGNFIPNILTRQSDKGQVGPSFPERQKLERSPEQIRIAIRDIIYIADQIEWMREEYGDREVWPCNREQCNGFWQCEYYVPHLWGWSDEMKQRDFQPRKEYLDLVQIQ